MNEIGYEIYKKTKRLIERIEKCFEKECSDEEPYKSLKKAIEHLDAADKEYAERYAKEKSSE